MFVCQARSDDVAVLDVGSMELIEVVPAGEYAAAIAIYPERRKVYCGNTAAGTVTVIDADSLEVVATVPSTLGAGHVGIDATRDVAYAVNFATGDLTMIDGTSDEVLGTVAVDHAPARSPWTPSGTWPT